MINIDIDYIILNILMLFIFYLMGKKVSKKKSFWPYAFICIITFTLIMGLRYDRGPDYFSYIREYKYPELTNQPGFLFINSIMYYIGVNEYGIFSIYALISICLSFIFLKKYKRLAQYTFPLFLIATIWHFQNPIRQSLSFSFVLLFFLQVINIEINSIKDVFGKKNFRSLIKAFILWLIAGSIHTANFFISIIFLGLHFLVKRTIPFIIAVPLLVFFTFVLPKIFDLHMISPFLSMISGTSELTDHYISRSERYFSADSVRNQYVINPMVRMFEFCGNLALVYFTNKLFQLKIIAKEHITYFNYYFIGTLLISSFKLIEILARVGKFTQILWFIPLSLVLYYRKIIVKNTWEKLLFCFLIYWIYEYFRYLLMNEGYSLFLWDKWG